MANIKKNFNFRNGVQVDDDNLLVTSTGLVGIGTTIPVESLDVRGNVLITGFTSATSANIGFLTVTTFEPTNIIGAGLSVKSGIVTAQGTGILTYFGDARNLLGMPTSQWEDVDVGLGFTSIYNTGGNVGVGTEDPRSTVQVGANVDAGDRGVGISSAGNINASGIITATSFVGALTGDVTGNTTGQVTGNINSSGVSTISTLQVTELDVDGHTNLDNVSVSGVTTFSGLIDGNGGANIDNVQIGVTNDNEIDTSTGNLTIDSSGGTVTVDDQFEVTGVSTFTGLADFNGGASVDNVRIGVGGDNEIDTATGGLTIDSANGQTTIDDNLSVSGIATFDQDIGVVGTTTTRNLFVTGVSTFGGAINANPMTVSNVSVTQKLGIGFTDTPTTDIQVKKFVGDAEIQVSSLESIASLNVGREIGTAKTHTSEIRFGGGAGAPYSASGTSLDIINYDTGNFNYHLSGNNAGAVAGDFHWHKGINSARLMTLTGIGGSLGIGKTQPITELDVEGAGKFSGNLEVGNNLTVGGSLIGNVQGTLTGNVSGTLAGNANATVGISTLNNLSVAGIATFTTALTDQIGVNNTQIAGRVVRINDSITDRVFVSSSGEVGIRTDQTFPGLTINATQANASFGSIGVGVSILKSAVDFSNAGISTQRFMVVPVVDNAGQSALQNLVEGSVIYNSQANKLRVFTGSSFENCN